MGFSPELGYGIVSSNLKCKTPVETTVNIKSNAYSDLKHSWSSFLSLSEKQRRNGEEEEERILEMVNSIRNVKADSNLPP